MSDEPADEPVDDDEPNRFAWGPGELEILDPVTGKFVRIGRPPERVRKMLAEQSGEDKKPDILPKKKLHIHLHQK